MITSLERGDDIQMVYYVVHELSVILTAIQWLKRLGKYCLYVHEERTSLMCVHSTSRGKRHGS